MIVKNCYKWLNQISLICSFKLLKNIVKQIFLMFDNVPKKYNENVWINFWKQCQIGQIVYLATGISLHCTGKKGLSIKHMDRIFGILYPFPHFNGYFSQLFWTLFVFVPSGFWKYQFVWRHSASEINKGQKKQVDWNICCPFHGQFFKGQCKFM